MRMTRDAGGDGRALVPLVLVAVCWSSAPSAAQTPASGSSQPCESWAITAPGKSPGSTLVVCSRLLTEVPTLRQEVARLNALAARDEDARRDMQRFGQTLNDMARRLKPPDVRTLADQVAARLQRSGTQGDSAMANEVDRLRVGLREMSQKLDELRARPGLLSATDAAMAGEAGQAVARLDFEAARSLLDGLARIEGKIDDAQGPYAANPSMYNLVRSEAMESLERARQLGAQQRCAKGWSALATLRGAAEDTQKQGKLNASGLAWKDLSERAGQIVAELGAVDGAIESQRNSERQLLEMQQRSMRQIFELAGQTFEQRRAGAMRFANTESLRARVAQADQMRAQARRLADQGQMLEAMDLVVDGSNLLGRVETEGGRYTIPMQDLPKSHRIAFGSGALPMRTVTRTEDLLGPGALCR